MELVVLVLNFEFVKSLFRNHVKKPRIEILSKRHDQVEDLSSTKLLVLLVVTVLAVVVLHSEVKVDPVFVRVCGDEICVYLFLLSVLKHFLDEPLEVSGQVLVPLK